MTTLRDLHREEAALTDEADRLEAESWRARRSAAAHRLRFQQFVAKCSAPRVRKVKGSVGTVNVVAMHGRSVELRFTYRGWIPQLATIKLAPEGDAEADAKPHVVKVRFLRDVTTNGRWRRPMDQTTKTIILADAEIRRAINSFLDQEVPEL